MSGSRGIAAFTTGVIVGVKDWGFINDYYCDTLFCLHRLVRHPSVSVTNVGLHSGNKSRTTTTTVCIYGDALGNYDQRNLTHSSSFRTVMTAVSEMADALAL